MENKIINPFLRFLFVILLVVLFLLSWMVISLSPPINSIEQKWKQKREVGVNIPETFPLLIITPGRGREEYKAQIVEKRDLENFLKENSRYTYLVPQGQEGHLNKTAVLHNDSRDKWKKYFKVERLSDDKQFLEVGFTWKHDDTFVNIGWYDATDREIFPKYHRHYLSSVIAVNQVLYSLFFTVILWAIIFVIRFIIYRKLKKHMQKSTE